MGVETLLAFAATSLLVLLLPSASGRLLRDYGLAQGRRRTALLIPAVWLGYLLSGGLAAALYTAVHSLAPSMEQAFAWLGVAVLGLYVLRSQQKRLAQRLADNDNVPTSKLGPALLAVLASSVRPGLIIVVASLFFQMSESLGLSIESSARGLAAYGLAAFLAPFVQLVIAEPSARRIRHARHLNPASHKPRTRFIASRAVSAGYRRIAA